MTIQIAGSTQGEDTSGNERLVADIVRYAIACHSAEKPIRREGLRQLVFKDSSTRNIKQVLETADTKLRKTFGLTLEPLAGRDTKGTTATTATNNTGIQGTASKWTASRWVLTSVIPDSKRAVLEFDWDEDEEKLLGFATTVLSLILVNNMSLPFDQLVMFTRKLGVPRINALEKTISLYSMDSASDSQLETIAKEALYFLVRRGYITKDASAGGVGSTQTQGAQGPEVDSNYTWGPQAKAEFRPIDVARFIATATGQECTPELLRNLGRACGHTIVAPSAD